MKKIFKRNYLKTAGIVSLLICIACFTACKNPSNNNGKTGKPSYAITRVNDPPLGGSFTIKVDGELQTGTIKAFEHSAITLEGMPLGNNTFDGYSVSPAIANFNGDNLVTTFAMPSKKIEITAHWRALAVDEFNITPPAASSAYTVTVPSYGKSGDPVVINVIMEGGYEFSGIVVKGDVSANVALAEPEYGSGSFFFYMPNEPVTITIQIAQAMYDITVTAPPIDQGSIIVNGNAKKSAGETVTLTVTAASGYEVESVTFNGMPATKGSGNTWTFIMPAANVTVSASFVDEGTGHGSGDGLPFFQNDGAGRMVQKAGISVQSGWTRYEAEDAQIFNYNVDDYNKSDNKGSIPGTEYQSFYSGGVAAGFLNKGSVPIGSVLPDWSNIGYVKFTVTVPKSGNYKVNIIYNGDDPKTILVKLNDDAQNQVYLATRDGLAWDTVFEHKFIMGFFSSGENTIWISGVPGEGWANCDCIDICDTAEASSGPDPDPSAYFQDLAYGTAALTSSGPILVQSGWTRYEAESAVIYGSDKTDPGVPAGTESQSFYSGSSHLAAGGIGKWDTAVSAVNATWSNIAYVKFSVTVAQAGNYKVNIIYNGDDPKKILVKLNDGSNHTVQLPSQDGGNWNSLFTRQIAIGPFESGANELWVSGVIESPVEGGGAWMNLDCIDVQDTPLP